MKKLVVMGVLALAQTVVSAGDWPGYRGTGGDGISTEKLGAGAPKVAWKVPTLNGFSSFAVSGDKVYTQVNGAQREILVAMEAATGKQVWTADIGAGKYSKGGDAGTKDNSGGDGPRSTPTISEGIVYTFTQDLVLSAFDAQSGKSLWNKNLIKDFGGRNIGWNSAASAVVDGELVFVAGGGAGQSLLSFNKKTGELAWKGQDETITHATPVVATIGGERQVIFFMKKGLVSVGAKDGKALWSFPFDFKVSTAASPVVCGDIVYCSAGYGVGGGACRITKDGDKFTATKLWKIDGDKEVANHWSTPVYKDGYLYGMFSFKQFGNGPLKCVEVATGKVMWSQAGFGAGNAILVGDKVVALSDDGQVVIVEAASGAYKEVARVKAVGGKCWTTPAFANGKIYVRSTKEGACVTVE